MLRGAVLQSRQQKETLTAAHFLRRLLLLLQLSLAQLLALFLHFFPVPLGLLHRDFEVLDLLLEQGSILGGSDSERLRITVI